MLLSLLDGLRRGSRVRRVVADATAAMRVGDVGRAVSVLQPAYREAPHDAGLLTVLGEALLASDRLDDGMALLEQAVRIAPALVAARLLLARQLQYCGQIGPALEHLRLARELAPDSPQVRRAIVRPLLETCDWPAVERERAAILELIETRMPWTEHVSPVDVLLLGLPRSARRESGCARAREIQRGEALLRTEQRRLRARGSRLRIGYLSGDFRDHPVTHLARNLFGRHDRSRFEVHAFSYGRDDGSAYRRQVMAEADSFADVRGCANADIARMVEAAQIDILIDMAGHTEGSRLGVLAHRPAPVQAHYLGYPGTTGADYVDYFVADRVVAPESLDDEFTEAIVRLPDCFMISDEAIASCPPTGRAEHGLAEDAFVFVNFNQSSRITREVFDLWMEILREVPGSVLWLKHCNDLACERLCAQAKALGVDPQRLVFAPDLPQKEAHVARLRLADLGLDTFGRYNGHTSTADALWAGVPVVTIASDCFPGRVAASLLTASAMSQCVAADAAGYKAFAVGYAGDRGRQVQTRDALLAAHGHAPFFRPQTNVRALEKAYLEMWARCKVGAEPAAFDVGVA